MIVTKRLKVVTFYDDVSNENIERVVNEALADPDWRVRWRVLQIITNEDEDIRVFLVEEEET